MTRPNGVSTNYSYDNLSRLLSVLHQAGASTIDGATYTVDAAGNRTAKTDQRAGVTSNYSYDALYELTQVVQGANTTESYSYDHVGNRLSSLGLSPYTYNVSNELTSTPNASYTYDPNGNLLTKTDSTGTTNYTWDFENRLTSVTLPGSGGTVSFKYDPFGRRIQKSFTQGTTTNYVYSGVNIIEEVDSNGNALARYAQGVGIDVPLAQLRSGVTSYYEQDGLSTITSLSNAAGSLAQTYTYDSFGTLTASTGSLVNPLRFTGREFDSETNLYYYRARFYDPVTGRFISEDAVRMNGDVDFYRYSYNAPTKFIDPFGLTPCKSGKCGGDCPDGVWESGVAVAEGEYKFGPFAGGGLVFSGVFLCRSNPTFNVPWVSFCGQGFAGKKMPVPKDKSPNVPVPGKGPNRWGGGVGGAFIRCRGIKCTEGLGGWETGKFLETGPVFSFKESSTSGEGTCSGIGVEVGGGFYYGALGCYTFLGNSLTR